MRESGGQGETGRRREQREAFQIPLLNEALPRLPSQLPNEATLFSNLGLK